MMRRFVPGMFFVTSAVLGSFMGIVEIDNQRRNRIRDVVGVKHEPFVFTEVCTELRDRMSKSKNIVVCGRSGAGKSLIVKELCDPFLILDVDMSESEYLRSVQNLMKYTSFSSWMLNILTGTTCSETDLVQGLDTVFHLADSINVTGHSIVIDGVKLSCEYHKHIISHVLNRYPEHSCIVVVNDNISSIHPDDIKETIFKDKGKSDIVWIQGFTAQQACEFVGDEKQIVKQVGSNPKILDIVYSASNQEREVQNLIHLETEYLMKVFQQKSSLSVALWKALLAFSHLNVYKSNWKYILDQYLPRDVNEIQDLLTVGCLYLYPSEPFAGDIPEAISSSVGLKNPLVLQAFKKIQSDPQFYSEMDTLVRLHDLQLDTEQLLHDEKVIQAEFEEFEKMPEHSLDQLLAKDRVLMALNSRRDEIIRRRRILERIYLL